KFALVWWPAAIAHTRVAASEASRGSRLRPAAKSVSGLVSPAAGHVHLKSSSNETRFQRRASVCGGVWGVLWRMPREGGVGRERSGCDGAWLAYDARAAGAGE